MRIGIVSAHFPPNFVSGGTLVPARLADALARRGHDVHVFAGRLDDGAPDMVVSREITEDGVTIHWVTVTGFVSWANRPNFDNPRMHSQFLSFLDEARPEVVHFHALQTMGASLVPLARASGAVTLVTAHDMWWWCARQFTVDREFRPCSPVVDCSVCPCEVDNAWLRDRNSLLAEHLRAADRVFAPSTAMAKILAANGVPEHRLAVDENPGADTVDRPDRVSSSRSAGVRFLFAGGANPMKGGQIAVEAAQELRDLSGWTLDLAGYDPFLNAALGGGVGNTGASPQPADKRITGTAAYPSDKAIEVLAAYDVLILPSLALETYSLQTREAVAAGCVVITSDCPGPTEVIKDGVNGLVVPRGDVPALAAAMRQLVEEPGLLVKLRSHETPLQRRTVDEQARAIEATVAAVMAEREVQPSRGRLPIRHVLFVGGIGGAPLRYRAQFPAEALNSLGIRADVHMYRDVEVPTKARIADAVVFYRVPATRQILDVVQAIRERPKSVPIVFDIDDLIFDPDLAEELNPKLARAGADLDLYWQGVRRYRTSLEASDAYIGSTTMLRERVAALTGMPTYLFDNGVGREVARASDAALRGARKAGPVRIGYFSGTNTHNEDWAVIEPAVARLLQVRPEVELWLGGLLEPTELLDDFSARIVRLPLVDWWELPKNLRDVDVNLAPLVPGMTFNDAKSAVKWLEAALVETPTIASPSAPFREVIESGTDGFLAVTQEEWFAAMVALVDDADLRDRMGHLAHDKALLRWSPQAQGHRYLRILEEVRDSVEAHGHREIFSNWVPETISEPWGLWAPDSYGPLSFTVPPRGPLTEEPRTISRIARDYKVNAVNHLRTEGPARTARKTLSVVRRLARRIIT